MTVGEPWFVVYDDADKVRLAVPDQGVVADAGRGCNPRATQMTAPMRTSRLCRMATPRVATTVDSLWFTNSAVNRLKASVAGVIDYTVYAMHAAATIPRP